MERELILTRLLEKYENSKHLSEPNTSRRRVMLRIDKNDLPEYKFETAELRDRFNSAAQALEDEDIIEVKMLRDRPVISMIVLNLLNISKAYQVAEKTHPKQAADEFSSMILNTLANAKTHWIQSWRDDTCKVIIQTMRLPPYCKKGTAYAREFLNSLVYYDKLNGATITTRAFSTACFQDSKRFEKEFQDDFLRAATHFHPDMVEISAQEDFGAREKLAVLGIFSHPEFYQLSGQIAIITSAGAIDCSPLFPHGIAIPDPAVDDITSFELNKVRKVIFIENLTSYSEYLRTEIAREELVVYHGGYLSPKKRQFLHKLSESTSMGTDVYFWGDIDLGGFQMFSRLKNVFPNLQSIRMSADIVEKYAQFGLVREPAYIERLKKAASRNEFPRFQESIRMVLHYGVTIEQEVFLQV